jgi:hypothetical protein
MIELIALIVIGYVIGMCITGYIIGIYSNGFDEMGAFLCVTFWPLALPVTLVVIMVLNCMKSGETHKRGKKDDY